MLVYLLEMFQIRNNSSPLLVIHQARGIACYRYFRSRLVPDRWM